MLPFTRRDRVICLQRDETTRKGIKSAARAEHTGPSAAKGSGGEARDGREGGSAVERVAGRKADGER
ncbi:MAG TPA: hypothetical protein VGO47_02420 [Chlamydiales bacterium]|nr:hypothetical protein [Chlamydiales bacterium]